MFLIIFWLFCVGIKLLKAKDAVKDQTFFLSQIPQRALQHTLFPLGDLTKTVVKQLAMEAGLEKIVMKKEVRIVSISVYTTELS